MTEEVKEEEIVEEVTEEVEVDAEALAEARESARKYGWRPKEDFDLEPKGWVDADRFLELPSTQNKMLKDELKSERENRTRESETFQERLDRLDKANKAAMDLALQQAQEKHQGDLKALQEQQRRAAEDGDMDRFDKLEAQRAEMKPPEAPRVEDEPKEKIDPEVAAYKEKNEWAKDPLLWDTAVRAVGMNQDVLGKPASEQLAFAESRIKELFPHKFEAPKPKVNRVDGGGLAGGSTKKGASSLPPEAVQAGKDFIEAGIYKDMDAYAAAYFEQG